MNSPRQPVVGIDVGGHRKGFHAVALQRGAFIPNALVDPARIVDWCVDLKAQVVAVDAPCLWSASGSSRRAERDLNLAGNKIQSFATPTRAKALAHTKGFYDWVFNGEELFKRLNSRFPLFTEGTRSDAVSFETFPHAVVCALAGKVIPAKPKNSIRRKALAKLGYDVSPLRSLDFIDAALCAVTAEFFRQGRVELFGDAVEGFIVVPRPAKP